MFSLVLCTINRQAELDKFFEYLAKQTAEYQLIIVDQNNDDRVNTLLKKHRLKGQVNHLKTKPIGLSKARNIGLKEVQGDIVAFPDDDCWYRADLLSEIEQRFASHPQFDFLTFKTCDEHMVPSAGMFLSYDADISTQNILSAGNSCGLFIRRKAQAAVGGFDERLGVGSNTTYGAGEEADFMLKACAAGFKGHYFSDLYVHHPNIPLDGDRAINRAKKYAPGLGLLFRRHHFPATMVSWRIIKPFLGGIFFGLTFQFSKAKYKFIWSQGLIKGYFSPTELL